MARAYVFLAVLAVVARGASSQTCAVHTACSSTEYCDSGGSCYACGACSSLNNAIDGICPAKCGGGVCNDRKDYCLDGEKTLSFWYGKILVFSIFGAFFGIASIVLGCLPTCCGAMVPQAKMLGGGGIVLAIVAFIFPMLGSNISSGKLVNKCCGDDLAECCEGVGNNDVKADLKKAGLIVAYTLGLGFLAVIIGIVGIVMSGMAICGCCKANPNKQPAVAGAVVQGAVVQGEVAK